MSGHTKGPWMWVRDRFSGAAFLVSCEKHKLDPLEARLEAIADDGSAYGEYAARVDPESANARLIAAAPDLLEALESAKEWMAAQDADQSGIEVWVRINKAIARAKGESK